MTSDRPYRKAMSHEDALRELRKNAGTQFDPQVVEALMGCLYGDRTLIAPDAAAE
jgi:HD-GYP domain-containing protein (c-di-GMP phosphodiesterase class II)